MDIINMTVIEFRFNGTITLSIEFIQYSKKLNISNSSLIELLFNAGNKDVLKYIDVLNNVYNLPCLTAYIRMWKLKQILSTE